MAEIGLKISCNILLVINLLAWWRYLKSRKGLGIIKSLIPFNYFFRFGLPLSTQVISMLVIYFEILLLSDLMMLISDASFTVYTVFFLSVISLELIIFLKVFCDLISRKKGFFFFAGIIIILAIGTGVITISKQELQVLNIVDFVLLIVKIILSIIVIVLIGSKRRVEQNVEAVVIILGFVILYLFTMFESGFIFDNYVENWQFGLFAQTVILIYWLGSSIWLRKYKVS